AGIGEAAIDPAEGVKRPLHRFLYGGGIADIADLGVDLSRGFCHGGGGGLVFLGITAPDRDATPTQRKCVGYSQPNTPVAAGDDRHAAGKVENTHGALPYLFDASRVAPPTMDKRARKIKYAASTAFTAARTT